jgi:diguanylate cyclase (GGDEF)-like protein
MLGVIAIATAGLVTLAGGGGAYWLSVPAALLACETARTVRRAPLRAALVVAGGAVPILALPGLSPLPPPWLALLVPGASVAVACASRARLERQRDILRRSSLTDALTGIANRRLLLSRMQYEIARHARAGRSFAVVMLDLDGFKALNDRFGHAAGDDLLRDVAAALERTVRSQDTAARIGGDEFCVLAPETAAHGLDHLEGRLVAAVATVTVGIETVKASLGSALFPADGRSAEALLAAADRRLLTAKRQLPRDRSQRRAA